MSDFYIQIRDDTVIPLIQEFGQTITRTRIVDAGTFTREFFPDEGRYGYRDSATNTVVYEAPAATISTMTGEGVITDFRDELVDDSHILQGDKLLLTINLGTPQVGDIFTVQGVDYNYVNHETVSPGGTDVLYRIQLRV